MAARYDAVAETYASTADDYTGSAVATLLELVGPDPGPRVLDVACGHGPVARELARREADVIGVDISSELLNRARSWVVGVSPDIEYVAGDAMDPTLLEGEVFDLVVCNFGLLTRPSAPASTEARDGLRSPSPPREDARSSGTRRRRCSMVRSLRCVSSHPASFSTLDSTSAWSPNARGMALRSLSSTTPSHVDPPTAERRNTLVESSTAANNPPQAASRAVHASIDPRHGKEWLEQAVVPLVEHDPTWDPV